MTGYLLPGVCGLLLGIMLHWTGLNRPDGLKNALGLRRSYALRSALYALGASMALTALLCWLAVIDVDTIDVYPLHGGVLLGGALFGIAAGLCGLTPMISFAAVGGNHRADTLEALCVLAGCLAAVWIPLPEAWMSALRDLPPQSDATLFRVTLDEPFLLGGEFLGQGCVGLLLMAAAICIPSPRVKIIPDEEITEREAALLPPAPEDAPADAFVALLPGEEPLVIDTALDESEESTAKEGSGEDAEIVDTADTAGNECAEDPEQDDAAETDEDESLRDEE